VADEKGVGLKGWLSGPRPKTPIDQPGLEKSVPLDKRRIAVLPMTNISKDQRDEYFAEGITDELIAAISKIPGLHVIARTSSEKYKGSGKGISEIGKELRIGTILEGTVRTVRNQLRVTAQLIDSQTEESLWSETYDRKLGDVFDIQTDIARNVADGLKIRLHARIDQQAPKKPTANTEAYAHYLKGRYFWNRGTFDFAKTRNQFELAIQKDPAFALGYSALADIYLRMSRSGDLSPELAYPKALELAKKATALDGTLGEPYVVLAAIRQEYEWKWDEARAGFQRAIELNPSNSIARAWYAFYLGHVGRCELGIEEAKRAIELDPLSVDTHRAAAEEYLFAHDYDKSIDEAETMMELFPESPIPYANRAIAEVEKGMYDDAITDFQRSDKLVRPEILPLIRDGRLGHAYAKSGRTVDANRILRELENVPVASTPKRPSPPRSAAMDIGLVYVGLGNNHAALGWLEKAADERISQITHLKCEPIFSSIRREPGNETLLHKIGLDRARLRS